MKTIASYLCALVLALFAFAPLAPAAGKPPELLSYQGYLVDANGVPLGTNETGDPLPANYDVVFRIYSASSGGTLLWAEEQTITVDNGYFSVLLGEGAVSGSDPRPDLSTVFTGIGADERFVGVSVRFQAGGEFSEILPRLRLLTSPYSFLASQARSVVNPDGQSLLTAEGGDVSVAGSLNATNLAGSGGGLTNLNASQVSSGTIADARLSGNVARLNTAQTFTQHNTFSSNVLVSGSGSALKFAAGLGQHINMFENSYGLGIQNSTMYFRGDSFAWYNGGVHNDTMHNPGGGASLMRLDSSGRLHAQGGITLSDSTLFLRSPTDTNHGLAWRSIAAGGQDGPYLWGNIGGTLATANGTKALQWDNNGHVVVAGRLHAQGFRHNQVNFAYYNANAQIGTSSGTIGYGVWADHRIAASEFNAISDARVKEVVGLTDPAQDLETIRRLRVTDYYSVDKVTEGDDLKKGFIAQEVAEIIPEAVSLSEQFVPDIFALPTKVEHDVAAKELRIFLSDAHDLEEGDTVRILASDGPLELPVASVESPEEFVLGSFEGDPEQIFVYGKRVSDFHTLHYDRIFTTGIGAIQELVREVDSLKARTAELEAELSRMRALEDKLAGLQATVEALTSLQAATEVRAEEVYAADGGEE